MSSDIPISNTISDPRSLLKMLQAEFSVFREAKPLAIGIDKQLLASRPELDRKTLRVALGMHTHTTRYLKAIANGTTRFALDGSVAAEITDEQRAHAAESLRERIRKEAERHKAQKALEAAERQKEANERQRTAKLGQLVAKFGRT